MDESHVLRFSRPNTVMELRLSLPPLLLVGGGASVMAWAFLTERLVPSGRVGKSPGLAATCLLAIAAMLLVYVVRRIVRAARQAPVLTITSRGSSVRIVAHLPAETPRRLDVAPGAHVVIDVEGDDRGGSVRRIALTSSDKPESPVVIVAPAREAKEFAARTNAVLKQLGVAATN